ncbi:hypothetical protein K435DRAFT_858528 [Dendrothele bispora CBS 962.96]|uniref:Uncharacterized protein n=1 Tax=Dendrothele bispora (strain CBS 962.96) TaxID=1314807 RepID=A0A4S8M456_DENBC|nr:hypothetical protein K435DRAFT_858528 [Dendrothele bispora CBS 962.96]
MSPRQVSSIRALPPKKTATSHYMSHECNIRKRSLVLAPNHQRILFSIHPIRLPQSFKPFSPSSNLYPYANVFSIVLHNIRFLILPQSSLLSFKLQVMVQQYKLSNHLRSFSVASNS